MRHSPRSKSHFFFNGLVFFLSDLARQFVIMRQDLRWRSAHEIPRRSCPLPCRLYVRVVAVMFFRGNSQQCVSTQAATGTSHVCCISTTSWMSAHILACFCCMRQGTLQTSASGPSVVALTSLMIIIIYKCCTGLLYIIWSRLWSKPDGY